MKKALIIDTSMFCCWLKVPGKETCGTNEDGWDFERVNAKIQEELAAGSTLVLPLAAIIETGNHIAQAKQGNRFDVAKQFQEIMIKAADNTSPWAAFDEQSRLWDKDGLKELADQFPEMASRGTSIGDLSIKFVVDYYHQLGSGVHIEILTGDALLKSYEHPAPTPAVLQVQPRRRR